MQAQQSANWGAYPIPGEGISAIHSPKPSFRHWPPMEKRDVWQLILAASRAFVRAVLAVILFAVACSALTAISLIAMYFDHRPETLNTSES